MQIFEKDIAIDMGTSTTLLFEQGKGIVAREPTVVAVDRFSGKIQKVGQDAQRMLGRTPANIVAIHPISAGVISDYEMAAQMQRELVSRITSFSLFKPCVLCCVPSSISGVEERAVIDAAIEAGARKVYLLEQGVATALGAGVDISKPDGHMVVDIGGGTTEIAMISAGGVVECESIKTAGGNIGCVMQRPDMGIEEVKGRNLANGLPKTVRISSNELIEAFVEPMNDILEAIHAVLERTPPQLVGDLDQNGIIISGGGSLVYGMDRLIERSTGIRTLPVDDPVSCATYGAGKMLKHLDEMKDGMMNFYRMRQLR